MRYVVFLLLLASCAFADTNHSFTLKLNKSARMYKVGIAPYTTNVRDASTATSTVSTSTDSLIAAVAYVDAATDSFKIWRSLVLGDTLCSITSSVVSEYLDDIAVSDGNACRFDSVVVSARAKNGVFSGGCTGMIYAYISLGSCAGTSGISPTASILNANYNDYLTPGSYTAFTLFDSVLVDTNVIGMGDAVDISWTITNRAILDNIECLINATLATPSTFQIHFVACLDKDSVQPSSTATTYDIKLSWNSHDNGSNPMGVTTYWTEVEPRPTSTYDNVRGFIRNSLRNLIR